MHAVYAAAILALSTFTVASPTPDLFKRGDKVDCSADAENRKTDYADDPHPFNKVSNFTPDRIDCNVGGPGNATSENIGGSKGYRAYLAPKDWYVGQNYKQGDTNYCLGYLPVGQCAQLACSYGGGVHVCNDNADKLQVVGQDVSNIVQAISDQCVGPDKNLKPKEYDDVTFEPISWYMNGQAWLNGWNVILGGADC